MSNSPLIDYVHRSPNHGGARGHKIDTVSIHCMAGNMSVESCGALFSDPDREASSNYGIGSDGSIALYVDECNRSFCSSNRANDDRAVTIEVANTVAADPWPVSDAAYKSLINLLVDICQRNGIKKLLWKGDKSLIGHVDKQNMTVHRWFDAKACPGDWLYNRHGQIAKEVNERIDKLNKQEDDNMDVKRFKELFAEMRRELQDNDAKEYSKEAREWAVKTGIVQGGSVNDFNGMWEDFLTREQMVTILYRFAQALDR